MEENKGEFKKKALICLILWPILTLIIFLIVMNMGILIIERKKINVSMPVLTTQLSEDGKTVVIKIDKPENGILYYTLDGSDPTEQSAKYENEFTVDHDVILKSLFIDENGKHSQIETKSISTAGISGSNDGTIVTAETVNTTGEQIAKTEVIAKTSDDLFYDIDGVWRRTNEKGVQFTYTFRRTVTDQGQMECEMIMPKGNGDGYSASILTSKNASNLLEVAIGQVENGGMSPMNRTLQIQCEPFGDNQIVIDGEVYDYIGK